ncbi:hypothetical protein BaRGS_00004551 [Batillaria attramentaria]|uniref:Uncharacterized protein n=1 Tax=Batillaria attramentaria TaxID=370345 RepID=A0ABD0LXX1_9CAEN
MWLVSSAGNTNFHIVLRGRNINNNPPTRSSLPDGSGCFHSEVEGLCWFPRHSGTRSPIQAMLSAAQCWRRGSVGRRKMIGVTPALAAGSISGLQRRRKRKRRGGRDWGNISMPWRHFGQSPEKVLKFTGTIRAIELELVAPLSRHFAFILQPLLNAPTPSSPSCEYAGSACEVSIVPHVAPDLPKWESTDNRLEINVSTASPVTAVLLERRHCKQDQLPSDSVDS